MPGGPHGVPVKTDLQKQNIQEVEAGIGILRETQKHCLDIQTWS